MDGEGEGEDKHLAGGACKFLGINKLHTRALLQGCTLHVPAVWPYPHACMDALACIMKQKHSMAGCHTGIQLLIDWIQTIKLCSAAGRCPCAGH